MRRENERILQILRGELQFVRKGGYRVPLVWRAPFVFEDSPICPKRRHSSCTDCNCTLMSFVPRERLSEPVPCRHIPLNQLGETLESLYRTGTNDEIEQALQAWLVDKIGQIEELSDVSIVGPSGQDWFHAAA